MSWVELGGSDVVVTPSGLESEILGLVVGRVSVPRSAGLGPDELCAAIEDLDVEMAVVRIPADRSHLGAWLAVRMTDSLVLHVDTLVYWSLITGDGREPSPSEAVVIRAELSPGPARMLVEEIFSGYQNHYTSNPLLQSPSVGVAYGDWAARHIAARGPVQAIEVNHELAAIATLSSQDDHIEILLAGVSPTYQRRGLYLHLLSAVERFARDEGRDSVVISTQAHNTGVQRAWARFGFLPAAAFDTLHVMKRSVIPTALQDSAGLHPSVDE